LATVLLTIIDKISKNQLFPSKGASFFGQDLVCKSLALKVSSSTSQILSMDLRAGLRAAKLPSKHDAS